MSSILIMLLLNIILENMTFNDSYIIHLYTRRRNYWDLPYSNIHIGNIPWILFFRETLFSLYKSNIKCWLLFPSLTSSTNSWHINHLLAKMSSIFIVCKCQLKCCWNQYELTYNVGYCSYTNKYVSSEVENQ